MKQSLDTRTKLLTKNPISLMIELSIPAVLGMVVVGLYNERLVKKMKERSKRLWEIWWQWYFYCQ